MTKKQAIELCDSKFWEPMSYRERAEFQMIADRFCMPFSVFHEAIEKTLERSVWTHEFALNREGLKRELFHNGPSPSIEDIMNMIPENKRIIVSI